MILALDWIDWPAVAVLIGVSATWAEAWLRNKRETRRDIDLDNRLRYLEDKCVFLEERSDTQEDGMRTLAQMIGREQFDKSQ